MYNKTSDMKILSPLFNKNVKTTKTETAENETKSRIFSVQALCLHKLHAQEADLVNTGVHTKINVDCY